MTILLTGGTGFVGINIAQKLLVEDKNIVIFSLTPLIKEAENLLKSLPGKFVFVQGDILDTDLLDTTIKKYGIKKIIHAAVITPDVNREIKETKRVVEVNCLGTVNILEVACKNNIEKFIYLSSVTVYGKTAFEEENIAEDSKTQPNTLYGITKYAAERIALRFKDLQNLNVKIVRIGHVFGPWEHRTGVRDLLSPIYQVTKKALLGEEAKLPRTGERGSWVYCKDVSNAVSVILDSENLENDVFNISSGRKWSVEKWCKLLSIKYPSFKYSISDKQEEANINYYYNSDHTYLDVNRLISDAQYTPKYDMEDSFYDYIEWVQNNERFWLE